MPTPRSPEAPRKRKKESRTWWTRVKDSCEQQMKRKGPYYERWKRNWRAGMEKKLREMETDDAG